VETIFSVLQVAISVILIFLVLMHSGKDSGLSGAFGVGSGTGPLGGGSMVERNLNRWTVFFAVLFLLNAQQVYLQAEIQVVQARANRLSDTAALFQALGGGWWNRADVAPNPYTPDPDPATVAAPNTVPGTPAAKETVQ